MQTVLILDKHSTKKLFSETKDLEWQGFKWKSRKTQKYRQGEGRLHFVVQKGNVKR